MAQGDTKIKMNFEVGGAAAANAVMRSVYQGQIAGLKSISKEVNTLGVSMRKVGRSMLFGVAGYAGVTGVSAVFTSLNEGADEFIRKRGELEKAVTPLMSLGDNISKMGQIRSDVVRTAIAMGRSIDEVSGSFFDLQSNTGNLSEAMREDLKKTYLNMAKVTGGDLATAQNLLTKSYQISGHEVKNLTELSNKLMYTQEQAALRFEDLATRAPEVISAGSVVGVNFNEVMASIIGATKKSGSIEKTFTGMRNVFLLMEEAQKKGITLTGSYTNKLAQLREQFSTNNAQMRKLFGQESVVAAKVLADSVDDVSASLATLEGITGDTDVAMEKLREKMKDPTFRQTQKFSVYDATIDNAPNMAEGTGGWHMNAFERYKQGGVSAAYAWEGKLPKYMSGTIGGAAGLISPSIAEEGRQIAMSQMPDELFRAEKRAEFERNIGPAKERLAQIDKILNDTAFGQKNISALDEARYMRERRTLVDQTRMPGFLMTPEERSSHRGMDQGVIEENTRAMRDLTRAMENSGKAQSGAAMKPGGAPVNYQEGT